MSTTTSTTRTSATRTSATEPVNPVCSTAHALVPNPMATSACHLYDACLKPRHQSQVEAWIIAASDKLHEAVVGYLAAIAAVKDSEGRS